VIVLRVDRTIVIVRKRNNSSVLLFEEIVSSDGSLQDEQASFVLSEEIVHFFSETK